MKNNPKTILSRAKTALRDTQITQLIQTGFLYKTHTHPIQTYLTHTNIGFLLVHERMLEAFINARDRFLKNGGLVMPSRGDIFAQPITDGQLWQEQEGKASFWRRRTSTELI